MRPLITLALLAPACTATMVQYPGSRTPGPYAPVNESSRPGVIKYATDAAPEIVRARRQDAQRQMYAACHGRYRIDAEGPQYDPTWFVDHRGNLRPAAQSTWYIRFSCVSDATPSTATSQAQPSTAPPPPRLADEQPAP